MNRKIYKISVLLLSIFMFSGCDTWEDDLNIDPNNPTTGGESTATYDYEPSEFMLDMLYTVVHGWDYIFWNVAPAVCEYHGKTISLSQGNRHQAWHAFDDSNDGGAWVQGYKAVRYIKQLRNAAIANNDIDYQAIATIWECYDFFNLTLLYGNIPYSQSIIDNAPLNPVYDKQEDIYFTLMSKLKAAGLSIDPSTQVDPATDFVCGGDMSLWKKFANTLLIRYAMYMSDAAPDSTKAVLAEILDQPEQYPVMESNNDNAFFHYDGVQYRSRYYYLASSKMDEAPFSNVFIERLVSLNDPRLPIYANPAKLVHGDTLKNVVFPSNPGSQKYSGHIYGITTDNAYASSWNSGSNYASKLGSYFRTEDDKGIPTLESASIPMALATYAEMLFFLAEATEKEWITTGISAQQYYEDAIKASFGQYNASFTSTKYLNAFNDTVKSFEEYIAQPQVNYEGGRDKLTLIAEQKWIASFLMMFDPYFDHRRTMLPELRASSGAEAFNKTGSATKFPSRAAYPNSETATNKANVDYANANGYDIPIVDQESANEALMWLLRPKGQDWLQMPIFQEPKYKSEYPARVNDPEFGTEFNNWYTNHWNTMFWWKN